MSICKDCICRKYCGDDDIRRCDRYFRDSSIKKEKTNEEWFCQLPTGEKAEFFANIYPKSVGEALIKISNGDKERWAKWLKEKHDDNM